MSNLKSIARAVSFAVLCTTALNACAEYPRKSADSQSAEYLPFSIRFDQKGNVIVLDENGRPVPPRDVEFPVRATALENVGSLSYVQYRGSHKMMIVVGGRAYIIPLPH